MNYSQVFPVGRALRLALGVPWTLLLWFGNPALTAGTLDALDVIGVAALALAMYLLATALIGQRVISRLNPWAGALLLDGPVTFAFIPGMPGFLQLGLLEYFGASLLCQGVCGYGGCEVLALPNMFLRTRFNVACVVFSPIDWLEAKLRGRRQRYALSL